MSKTEEELTEQTIQKRLNHFFASWKYNVDGLFVFSWESDKLLWTKAGYIYEFEIKVSRSDFKADFKHKIAKHLVLSSAMPGERAVDQSLFEEFASQKRKKYQHLSEQDLREWFDREMDVKDKRMPNYFYYAVPEGLIQPEEVPPYAGLLWLTKEYQYGGGIIRKKQAPCLHKTKYTDGELDLGQKFYYNWKSAVNKYREADKDAADLRKQLKEELASKGQEMTYAQMELQLKIARKQADEYNEKWGKALRESILNNAERERLRHVIRQMDPDYDFTPIEEEVEKIYGNKR